MKTDDSLEKSWDDLVFENRNRAYGAYVIRKSYPKNIAEGVVATFLFGGFLLLCYQLSFMLGNKGTIISDKKGTTVILNPPPIINLLELAIHRAVIPPKKTPTYTVPLVTSQMVEDVAVLNHPDDVIVQTDNKEGAGTPVAGEVSQVIAENPGIVSPPAILTTAEVMPAYDGGLQAMYRFIQRKLKYPSLPRKIGVEGLVFVSFVINHEGKVVNVKVIKGIHPDCDREAARVISLLPSWKPGMQNKMPVSVRMVLPIKFQLEN